MLVTADILLMVILIMMLGLLLSSRLRPDVVAILTLIALSLTQIITPEQALSGFSRPAVVTIIGLFILSAALENTGVVQWLGNQLRTLGAGSEPRLIIIFMAAGAILSLFMNNIAAGAVLLPAAVQVARDSGIRASRLLMPLSFGTLVGGMATYFTTANIVLSGMLEDRSIAGLGMLDFLPTGGLIVVATILYMSLIGRHWLPRRESVGQTASPYTLSRVLEDTYRLKERMWEVYILPDSKVANVPLSQSHIGESLGITVLAIWRGHEAILTPEPTEHIQVGDYLLVLGREERVRKLEDWGLQVGRSDGMTLTQDFSVDLTEVIIPPRSNVISKTLKDLNFRNRYGLTSVALWREGRSYRTDVGLFPLQVGDALLMVGPVKAINALANDRDFLLRQSRHAARPRLPHKAWIALITLIAVTLIAIFEWVPISIAMLVGAMIVVITGCLSMDEAYRVIEWRVVFLIAGMTSISAALFNTNLGERLGEAVVNLLLPFGPLSIIGGLFIITMLLTQIMGGQVSSLVIGPIVLSAALHVGLDPRAAAVSTAIACSTAFLLPTAHPVNVLMMGPGGYRAADFFKVGLGMTVITIVVTLVAMHFIWGVI